MAYKKQPSIAHLRTYGCRAYALRQRIPAGEKLTPRALIGYLVGYDATNVYRIWLPQAKSHGKQGKVIRIRDVTFDEKQFYHPTHEPEAEQLLRGASIDDFIRQFHEPPTIDPEDSGDETKSV